MPDPLRAAIGILAEHPGLNANADRLGERFGLPRLKKAPAGGFYLWLRDMGLELVQAEADTPGAVKVEFVSGAMGHRLRFGGGRGQPLARATGFKPGFNPTLWDATAGLGRDGFVLASLGSRVTLCERSPVLAALLEDGLQRARLNADVGAWVGERLSLKHGDSRELLPLLNSEAQVDVIYLDPMYPPGKQHVLVKKDIRALHSIIGPDRDSADLLETALQCARRRVVVKRPGRAGWLTARKPSTSIESKKTRYDVYVTL